MYDNDSKGISYTAGFFMLIAFVVAGFVTAGLISEQIALGMTGKSVKVLLNGGAGPDDGLAMKLIQSVTAVFGFFIPALITAILLHRKPFKLLGFTGAVQLNHVGLTILSLGLALLVATSLSYISHFIPLPETWKLQFDSLEQDYSKQIAGIIDLSSTGDYIVALVVLAFLPALCEETLFRGGLQNFLSRGTNAPWLSIIVVSILFSLAHASFYLFLSRFLLGVVLGAIYYYSGKLWLSILAHFINNALTITVLFVYIRRGNTLEQAMQDQSGSIWGILALPLLVGLLAVFKKLSLNRRTA